jgi:hypothetical protein
VFSPLWAAAIGAIGFPAAAAAIGLAMAITMWVLAETVFSRTPAQMKSPPDGDEARAVSIASSAAEPLPGSLLWRDAKFLTLAAGMALGLFAQIGLAVHLFSLLVPALGASQAGLAMGLVTAMAIAGRTLIGWVMPANADRRLVACASYAVQIAGCVAFIAADGANIPLLLLGVVLFGAGFGNGTWLPPLIAQVEFVAEDGAARGRADRCDFAGDLCLRAGGVRYDQGIRFAGECRFRRCSSVLYRSRDCAGARDWCFSRRPAPIVCRVGKGARFAPCPPTMQSILFVGWWARGACHRARVRATRWLCPPYGFAATASAPACRRDSRKSHAGSCGRASRPRRILPTADTAGTWNPPAPRAAPA